MVIQTDRIESCLNDPLRIFDHALRYHLLSGYCINAFNQRELYLVIKFL
jgi:hypothetical protein